MSSLRSMAFRGIRIADRIASSLPASDGFRPLRKPFSAYDALVAGDMNGSILHERQHLGPCPSGSITAKSRLGQHNHQPWPVFWVGPTPATLTGRIRLWRDDGDHFCIEGNYHHPGRRRLSEDSFGAHMFPGPAHELPGAWTSIASNWGDGRNYFHWITDNLTRLLVREHLPETTRILLPSSDAPYIRETLDMLGLGDFSENPPKNHLRVERFYFCSPTAMSGVWNPLGFDWLRERFSPWFAAPRSGPPVFLTRRGSNRIPGQLETIEAAFRRAGFEIVNCGEICVREQIRVVSAATAVAGIHGAAMTNLLWSPPETPVLEIFEPAYLNACYEQIAFQGKLSYTAHIIEEPFSTAAIDGWLQSDLPHPTGFNRST